jgi:hypothetical protein
LRCFLNTWLSLPKHLLCLGNIFALKKHLTCLANFLTLPTHSSFPASQGNFLDLPRHLPSLAKALALK